MRRSLTPSQRRAMWEKQGGICDCGCGKPIDLKTAEADHYVCVWLGNDGKPDALLRPECHKVKTRRDAKERARCKRLKAKWGGDLKGSKQPESRRNPSGWGGDRKMKSRPFQQRPADKPYQWPKRKLGQ